MCTSSKYISSFVLVALSIFLTCDTIAQRPNQEQLTLEGLFIEGNKLKLLGKDEEAIEVFKKMLKEDDQFDVIHYELAKLYLKTKANKEALYAIKKAVDLKPTNVWYKEELAASHEANDDFKAAAEIYRQLIQQKPNEQKFYFDLAFLYVKNNDIQDAIDVFNQHESKFGVSEEVISRKFNLYGTLDKVDKAESELVKLVKAFPSDVSYLQGLAKFYEDTNNGSKAKSTYGKILKLDPNNSDAQVALSRMDKGKSRNLDSDVWSDPNVNIDIKISKIVPSIAGLASSTVEKQEQLINVTQMLTETHPEEAKAFAVHGDVLSYSDRRSDAIAAFEQALTLEKNIFSVWNELLQLYLMEYRVSDIVDRSEEALDYFPNEPSLYHMSGWAHNYLGAPLDAINSLLQADIMTKAQPLLNGQIKAEMAKSYAQLNKADKVKKYVDEITAEAKKKTTIVGTLVETYVLLEDIDSAEYYVKAIANQSAWQVSYLHGLIAYTKGDYNQAKTILSKLVNVAPEGAFKVTEMLGDTLAQLNDSAGAMAAWKLSKENGNTSRGLQKKITSGQL